MSWNDFVYKMQDLHLRKVFFLVALIVAVVLFILKYWLFPQINRREDIVHRTIRRTIDISIMIVFAIIAVGAAAFWLSGND
ncbi:hypothetical protein D0C36_02515 [Mucilaginibacter conchicola]|uniref:Uncharacterized protein n=1 Tax=Mucilaginibacter conchicola TaxID=2303333 RepID=A0A372NX19_9SPHI|nr:hypothetical protein [Mucilaginibacter conchicola]RFZ94444.1 hypothetical protein D0C36_02515 [Mucilaginibacter conchicola]